MIAAFAIQWRSCPPETLPWISLRELLLLVLFSPPLLLPMAALASVFLGLWFRVPRRILISVAVLLPVAASLIYSPAVTALLTIWLEHQQPPPLPLPLTDEAVVVLVGRGPAIAKATTQAAAELLRSGKASVVYVSGDERATAERIEKLGIASDRIAGDSCARTTWENAIFTATWLHQNHPGSPVLLITDPWQLPRASLAFQRQSLQVQPIPVAPPLSAAEENRLALRETAATVLYQLQGRT